MGGSAVRGPAEVVARRAHGAFSVVSLAGEGLAVARPGQLVTVAPSDPRPGELPAVTWATGAAVHPGLGQSIDVVLPPGVSGRPALALGDEVTVTGPLGRGFRMPSGACDAVLVGEGVVAMVLLWVAARLRERGCRTQVLLVAPTVDEAPGLVEARRSADDLVLATRDGATSGGTPVAPEEVLQDVLRGSVAPIAYVGGPGGSVASWAQACETAGLTTQVAVDETHLCGIGLCDGCRIPVLGRDGRPVVVRRCVEGPVLPAGRIAWDVLGEERW